MVNKSCGDTTAAAAATHESSAGNNNKPESNNNKPKTAKRRKQETNNNITDATAASSVAADSNADTDETRISKEDELTSSSGGGGDDVASAAVSRSTSSTSAGILQPMLMQQQPDKSQRAAELATESTCCAPTTTNNNAETTATNSEELTLQHHHHHHHHQDDEATATNRLLTNVTAATATTTTQANGASNYHPFEQDIEQATQEQQQQQQQQHIINHNNNKTRPLLEENLLISRQQPNCKQKQLTFLQVLLIRKWPYLALSICIMGALIFGILLSTLTVLLMHGQSSDCSKVAALAKSGRLISGSESLTDSHNGASSPLRASREFELHEHIMSHLSPASDTSGAPGTAAGGASGGSASSGSQPADELRGKMKLQQQQQQHQPSRFQRLPTSVWPLHYDLFVQPYLYEPFNFTGKVLIRIKCTEATNNITLHALDLDLNSTGITLSSELPFEQSSTGNPTRLAAATAASQSLTKQQTPKVSSLSQDKQLQHLIIRLDDQLEPGREYLLGIDFVGFLNDDLAGFYKIKYELKNSTSASTQNTTTTWIAATQFQATDARRAFPCFDEPLYKATFSIKIKHWKNMTSLSNMPIVERQDSEDGHWVTDVFEKSHKMSTYLVAFAVTNFESRSEGNISVWTRPGFAHTAEYSLRIAGKLLRYYEDFFGIEYPLPKMDMIALPDFNAGAMENWGLITYRETSMLFDEAGSSIANKQRVATVVAHELAHQWFGNLVTPKWWDDLWLNEGFASYVEYIGVDKIEPKWKILDQFATEELQNVFRVDDLSSSHQISIPVNDPEEISEIFDHISYAKSASVIRMMHYFLTPEVFKTGLRRYLRALKYSNAEQSDLWAHLTEASRLLASVEQGNSSAGAGAGAPATDSTRIKVEPVDVGKVMNSWTLQVGYPLVTLNRQYGQAGQQQRAQLDQIRYRPTLEQQHQQLQAQKNGSQPVQKWEVPITYTWKSERNFEPITRIWLHQNDSKPVELETKMLPKSDDDWMLVNLGQVGYYRVNYDLQNWRLLIRQLNEDHQVIITTNRAQLLDDIFELARSGVLDYKFALDSTKYLKNERDFLPWDTVLTSFGYIDEMLQRTPMYGQWQDYIGNLIKPYYARYRNSEHWTMRNKSMQLASGAGDDNALEQYNLVNAISWACQVDQHCISKAKSLFKNWKDEARNEINPVVRFTVYCTAIENGDKDDWEFLWQAYEKEQNSSERDRILKALSCSKQMWILSRYLEWTFNKSKPIRRQDGAYIFRMIAKNNYGRDIAFNFVRERWTTIREHYGKTSFSLGALIRSLSYAMNTQIELNQLMNFYESVKSDVGTGKRSFQNAIEEVETNVQWRNKNYKILEDWITEANSKPK